MNHITVNPEQIEIHANLSFKIHAPVCFFFPFFYKYQKRVNKSEVS